MSAGRVMVVGGGASGMLAAITCAEATPGLAVTVLEKGPECLAKVRISGGGRCNVTHACFDPRQLAEHYPRGGDALLGPFHRFQPRDTLAWFEQRGVQLKTECDGRVFPTTDAAHTILQCLRHAAEKAGVELLVRAGVDQVLPRAPSGFDLTLTDGQRLRCDRLLLATGGCRGPAASRLVASLGHTLVTPVPSLFTFHIETPWWRQLAGISLQSVEVSVPGTALRERGPLLITHWGASGPSILKLSAWGARTLHERNYHFPLRINWCPELSAEGLAAACLELRQKQGARQLATAPPIPLPTRLWEQLLALVSIPGDRRWGNLTRPAQHHLCQCLLGTELPVTGKSLNKEEFVTCGGVRLAEVHFKTMESRLCPGLYLAGELLDIDGLTGGFNLQAAWTTGWIAGQAMALAP